MIRFYKTIQDDAFSGYIGEYSRLQEIEELDNSSVCQYTPGMEINNIPICRQNERQFISVKHIKEIFAVIEERKNNIHKKEQLLLEHKIYRLPSFISDVLSTTIIERDVPHIPRKTIQQNNTIMVLKRIDIDKEALYQGVKIGKYLTQNTELDNEAVNILVSKYKNYMGNNNAVVLTNSTADIKRIYENSGTLNSGTPCGSCMGGEPSEQYNWSDYFDTGTFSPASCYGDSSNIKLAYILDDARVVARALYSDKNSSYIKVYGTQEGRQAIADFFSKIEYSQSDNALDGHVINRIPAYNDSFIVPYIDGHHRIIESTGEIAEEGNLTTKEVYKECTIAECIEVDRGVMCVDGEYYDPEDESIYEYNGDMYTYNLLSDNYLIICGYCGSIESIDDSEHSEDGEYYCSESCIIADGHTLAWVRL